MLQILEIKAILMSTHNILFTDENHLSLNTHYSQTLAFTSYMSHCCLIIRGLWFGRAKKLNLTSIFFGKSYFCFVTLKANTFPGPLHACGKCSFFFRAQLYMLVVNLTLYLSS